MQHQGGPPAAGAAVSPLVSAQGAALRIGLVLIPMAEHRDPAVAARRAHQRNAALRAIDDPVKLQRAARIVRAALERNRLTLADLDPEVGE